MLRTLTKSILQPSIREQVVPSEGPTTASIQVWHLGIIALGITFYVLNAGRVSLRSPQMDFIDVYLAARVALHGGNPYAGQALRDELNAAKAPRQQVAFAYPPQALLLYLPFAQFSVETAKLVWVCSIHGAVIFLIVSMARFARASWAPPLLCAAFALFPPVLHTISLGQVNIHILLCLWLGFLLLERRPILAGAILALPAMIKLAPAYVLIYLFFSRSYRALFGWLLAIAIATVCAYGMLGSRIGLDFIEGITNHQSVHSESFHNQSLLGFVSSLVAFSKFSHYKTMIWIVGSCIITSTAAWVVYLANHSKAKTCSFLAYAFVITSFYLIGPYTESHHLVGLILPLLILIFISMIRQRSKYIPIGLGIVVALLCTTSNRSAIVQGWARMLMYTEFSGIALLWMLLLASQLGGRGKSSLSDEAQAS